MAMPINWGMVIIVGKTNRSLAFAHGRPFSSNGNEALDYDGVLYEL